MSPFLYLAYPPARRFVVNELLAQQLSDLKIARGRRSRRPRQGVRWLILAGVVLAAGVLTLYAATA
jgi:hypothetical protein